MHVQPFFLSCEALSTEKCHTNRVWIFHWFKLHLKKQHWHVPLNTLKILLHHIANFTVSSYFEKLTYLMLKLSANPPFFFVSCCIQSLMLAVSQPSLVLNVCGTAPFPHRVSAPPTPHPPAPATSCPRQTCVVCTQTPTASWQRINQADGTTRGPTLWLSNEIPC